MSSDGIGLTGQLASITLVVIDDHQLVSETLRVTLSEQQGIAVVGVADDGIHGIELVREHQPSVALIDYRLPDMNGAEVIRAITARSPDTKCVILTGSGQDRALSESIEAGALGFVTKHQRFGDVVEAIRAAAAGIATFPPALLANNPADQTAGHASKLSERERDVLNQLARGKSNSEIAATLFISVNTVRNHVANILTKLKAKSRTEAAAIAIRNGLISRND